MRFLFELAVFAVLAGIAFCIVFGITWAVGSPFGLDAGRAGLLALLVLCFWFPAFANVHIAAGGSGGQSVRERICASVRAFGMLVCSAILSLRAGGSGL
jgi:hypothetical protein